ncbi:branched-chain amino acid transport system II carrier protein [Fusobacterium sp. SB021]|uniref:branched-chain amino acid transport system II carrier protein n=1 Tax=Fusobacterium sp. SB021 TaxID=2744227 RepID=UPI003CE9AF14
MNRKKEVLILGFALFAMFFGAGNLIFPPSLGIDMGKDWLVAGIGFLLTGVGLPLLGVLAFTKVGRLEDFSVKISSRFNTLYCTALVFVIGPLFAIPRTGSTTFEMGVLPSFPNVNPLVLSIITSTAFFGITLILVIKESKITDIIGKFLTPVILIILAAIAFLGITGNIGTPVDKNITGVFAKGFVSGYQTMDALASVIFGVVIVKGLEGKGIVEEKEQRYFLSGSALIAAIGLGLIYFSLMYLGARVSGVGAFSTTSAALYLAEITLGSAGKIAFGICVATACLTTSVGLVAIASDWFARFTPISYKMWSVIICVFSGVMAIGGVDFIIKLSIPVLCILYPVTIILILLNVFGVKHVLVYRTATYTTLVVIILEEVFSKILHVTPVTNFLAKIPMAESGFVWVVPCLAGMAVAFVAAPIRKAAKLKAKQAEK